MADIVDDANQLAYDLNEDYIKAHRGLVPEENPDIHEDGECECGEIIPYARLRLGYDLCVSCASFAERYSKQYNRRTSRFEYDD